MSYLYNKLMKSPNNNHMKAWNIVFKNAWNFPVIYVWQGSFPGEFIGIHELI